MPRIFVTKQFQRALVLALMLASGAHAENSSPEKWTIADLGTLGGATVASAVNEHGQAVGAGGPGYGMDGHAFISRAGVIEQLGSRHLETSATGINNAGQVVGYYYRGVSPRPVLFEGSEVVELFPSLGVARAISSRGEIVGQAIGPYGASRAFSYLHGNVRDLGTLGGAYSYAYGVSDTGLVVGYSATATGKTHAFMYDDGEMRDLGTLGGPYSVAYAVNDHGVAVGHSRVSDTSYDGRAFIYTENRMHDLGTLGGTRSTALGINNRGWVVGTSTTGDDIFLFRAFLYREGRMLDLNSLPEVAESGWTLASANAINKSGQIVGEGQLNGQTRAFLLSPRGGGHGD